MKRLHLNTIISVIVTVFVFGGLALPEAKAMMSRGVYVNGKVHYMALTKSSGGKINYITHYPSVPDEKGILPYDPSLYDTGYQMAICNPDPGHRSVMNGAVFGQKIFFVFTGHPQASGTSKTCDYSNGTHLYVTYLDLTVPIWTTAGFAKDLGLLYHQNTIDKKDNPTDMASAAIVVFNGLLYIFSDAGTYTSSDGVNWSPHPGLPGNDSNLQPLDAITYYPPDADPRMMIIYGRSNEAGHYSTIWGATWNGKFGDDSDFKAEQINVANHTRIDAGVGLFAGTATPPASISDGTIHAQPGAKKASLQLVLGGNAAPSWPQNDIIVVEYNYTKTGGTWAAPGWVSVDSGFDHLTVFPWYTTECTTNNNIQRQNLIVNYFDYDKNGSPTDVRSISFTSDAMVPQNTDIPLNCTSSGGTGTDTGAGDPDEQATLRKYWSLVGVIMGSPPFALNNAQFVVGEIGPLSNVTYGQSQTDEVSNTQETENSFIMSGGAGVQAGLEHVFGIKDQLDLSYKHAWESAHERSTTSKVSYGFTMGTENASTDPEDADKLGMMGWGIFHVPTIIVQDYALYAYDYDVSTKSGTYLNQNVHTTQVDQDNLSYRQVAFELANPGGPNDSFPGLMTGIAPLTKSTDFTGWKQAWESSDSANHYKTLLGDATRGETRINTITFVNGSNGKASFSQDIKEVTTTGETKDVEVSLETELTFGTKLAGFKAGLKAGYDGHFSNSVTNTTTLGSDVEASLGIPVCYEPECIKTLTVQPYLLQATDGDAPWVPTDYNTQLPWAMHWRIVSYTTIGGAQSGMSPPANQAGGTVVGTSEALKGASGSVGDGSYYVRGGKMVWQAHDGTLTPIPMTAVQFSPSSGVSFSLNGYTWSSLRANGRWSRLGNIWTFRTSDAVVNNAVVLKLNFSNMSWDLSLSRTDLSPYLKVSEGRAHLELNINGKYEFYFDFDHDVEGHWDHNVLTAASDEGNMLTVNNYNGFYDPSTGMGTATLGGNLPAGLRYFGDFSVRVNNHQIDIPLISNKNYATALSQGKKLVVYPTSNLRVTLDFGKKTWQAYFHGKINPLLRPRSKSTTIQVKVGGELWYWGEHTVQDYTSKLKYNNPSPTKCNRSSTGVTCS